ncbi:MAG: hypothetical protein DLM65_14550 [Candidatus Aeolococcus gillhamiae]|uniref:Uncharacterized protein n=2 Tax=Candidatus Aeolococcus gillhamiae TaxID=3127015 RepID=A0A2W5ZX49_9BACT|nr:MAG: hypothetical protein DLM65_14550 [Candidatus Dormibacter sp. RRmetagenome_bin12]
MATSAPALLRAAAPLARVAAGAARSSTLASAASAALRRLEVPAAGVAQRHPLAPAAVRVERARARGNGTRTDQTAITVWFGQGPSLPGAGSDVMRSAMRIGTGVLGAAALAAMTAIAARREEQRSKVIDAPSPAVPIP